MRMTESFRRTLRQAPTGYDPSTALALRAALIRLVDQKIAYLPLGLRIAYKVINELFIEDYSNEFMGFPYDINYDELLVFVEDEIQSYRQLPLQIFPRSSILF